MDAQNKIVKQCVLICLSASMVLLLSACARDQRRPPHTLEAINAAIEEGVASDKPATARSVADELLPDVSIQLPGATGVDLTQRFDVKVKRVPARAFFMGLVQGTRYNMVVHPKVKGSVSLDLKNVTVPDVMIVLRNVFGYEFDLTSSGYQVFPNTMRTQIFRINYIDVERNGESQMSVSSGQVTQSNSSGRNRNSSARSNNYNSNSRNRSNRQTISGSRVSTKSKSNFWKELNKSLNAMIEGRPGRKIVVNGHSGVIVAHAMPSELRAIRKFIKTTQTIMNRQVILEAKIIEVKLSDGYQAGINWAAFGQSAGGNSKLLVGHTGGGSIFGGDAGITGGNTGNVNPSAYSAVDGTATSAFGGVFSIALKLGNSFASFIELLETQGDVQVLSSPQVSTINNQKAVIKVGTDEFFITNISTNTNVSTGTSNTTNNVELTPFFSGVALDVIPQISEDDEIILHIHPTVSSVTEKNKNLSTSAGQSLTVPLAVSTVRESDTIVKARDGQVIIIGGLMKNSTSERESSVPFLSDIPFIGGLFKHKQKSYTKSELVILLRPIIVRDGKEWRERLKRVQQRLGTLYPADG